MAQHFLLSAEARSLSPIAIARMSEHEAVKVMKKLRWGEGKSVVCSRCLKHHEAYFIKTRNQWQCYANEIAYREDTRRLSNGEIFNDVVSKCLASLPSDDWRGYWQGNRRMAELLAA